MYWAKQSHAVAVCIFNLGNSNLSKKILLFFAVCIMHDF